jgi:hypothetical protein
MLRLGGFTQTRDFLKRGNRYCANGLLCELFQESTGRGSWEGPYYGKNGVNDAYCFLVGNEWSIELPSPIILRWADIDKDFAMKLYKLNDIEKQTFAGIANYIEASK